MLSFQTPSLSNTLSLLLLAPPPSPAMQVQAMWRLMATRLISLLPCITLAVVFEATRTFDQVAQIINVVQSLCLPFGLIPLVQVTSDEKIMVRAFTGLWSEGVAAPLLFSAFRPSPSAPPCLASPRLISSLLPPSSSPLMPCSQGKFSNKGWVRVGISTIVLSVVGVNL